MEVTSAGVKMVGHSLGLCLHRQIEAGRKLVPLMYQGRSEG